MQITPPGGELTGWSVVWLLFALGSAGLGIATGDWVYYVAAGLVGLPTLGMWLEQHWCGYLFAGVMVLSLPLGLLALILIDDTLAQRALRLLRIGFSAYFAWITFAWASGE